MLSAKAGQVLAGKQILYIERAQYAPDHHNTATLFQPGEINEKSFEPGGAMRIFDVDTREVRTLIELKEGVVRDPEVSYDGKKIVFSMRKSPQDSYHIYEINADGSGLRQLTCATGVSDIDPVYLPGGEIIFTSTRQPKYCMCNRHIMGNLYRMNADGTKHAIYYGNNTASPGGVLDARQIPGTDLVVCIFSSCHDRPWGAMAIIDRRKGVDGHEAVVQIWPKESINLVGNGNLDSFK